MSRSLIRRIAAIEALLAPKPKLWPCIVEVFPDETHEAAIERHFVTYGPKPKSQGGLLVVPARPRTEEEDLAARKRTEERQAALMIFARQRPQSAEAAQ